MYPTVCTADTMRSPSSSSMFWNTPCVAGCVGPRFSVVVCFSMEPSGSFICSSTFIRLNCSSPSKHFIVFIYPGLFFQRELFAHGEIIHFVHVQNALEVWMAHEVHAIKIIGFTLHPVGRRKQLAGRV